MANRKIAVEIVGDASKLQRSFNETSDSAHKLSVGFGTLLKSAVAFAAIGAAADVLTKSVKGAFSELNEASKVAAQTNAVLASTGGVAGVSAKQVDTLAQSLLRKSGVDDEVIKSGENVLLTFRNIRNVAGEGNDVFNQATTATLNLSVALGKDMSSSAILVGKALNDRSRG
jgi:hypothetical protein